MIRKTALALAGLMMATGAYAAELKVGFVYVGPVGDFGWTYQHDQGRLSVRPGMAGQCTQARWLWSS